MSIVVLLGVALCNVGFVFCESSEELSDSCEGLVGVQVEVVDTARD